MKDLEINSNTILYPPDSDGDVEIEINSYDCMISEYVQFSRLEEWVFSIREQITAKAIKG